MRFRLYSPTPSIEVAGNKVYTAPEELSERLEKPSRHYHTAVVIRSKYTRRAEESTISLITILLLQSESANLASPQNVSG